jgi:hypothetical protein
MTSLRLTVDDVRARMRAAGLEIAEARLEMVRTLLEYGLIAVHAMDSRAARAVEPAITFDAAAGPTEVADDLR